MPKDKAEVEIEFKIDGTVGLTDEVTLSVKVGDVISLDKSNADILIKNGVAKAKK